MMLPWFLYLVLSWLIFLWVITKLCLINFYRRYIDSIICIFNRESDVDTFFEFLSTKHSNIKFTFEKQVNNQTSFLDVHLTMIEINFSFQFSQTHTKNCDWISYVGFTPFSRSNFIALEFYDK